MDTSGKLIWARHNEVVSSIIKGGGMYNLRLLDHANIHRCLHQRQRTDLASHQGSRHLRSLPPDTHSLPQRSIRRCLR
jgi:hypothetical protein